MSTSRIRTILADEIAEGSTPPIRATFLDDNGAAHQPTAATLTLHYNGTIINSRDATNLLGYITAGVLKFTTAAEDFAIQGSDLSERHVALIEWTWTDSDGHTRKDKHEIVHTVRNFLQVP
jgi:hypothetical protein